MTEDPLYPSKAAISSGNVRGGQPSSSFHPDPRMGTTTFVLSHIGFDTISRLDRGRARNTSNPSIGVGTEEGRLPLDRTILL